MTIAAYQILYESSVAFGMRKSLMSEQGKLDMEESIQQLDIDKKDLEKQVLDTLFPWLYHAYIHDIYKGMQRSKLRALLGSWQYCYSWV